MRVERWSCLNGEGMVIENRRFGAGIFFRLSRLRNRWLARRYDSGAWEKWYSVKNLKRVYEKEGWEGGDGEYRRRNSDRLVVRMNELHSRLGREISMADVACFNGDYFGRLEADSSLEGKFRYTGFDITTSFVEAAASQWAGFPNAEFCNGSAFELPVEDDSFDLVLNSGMLIHVDQPAAAIAEFARVAREFMMVEVTALKNLETRFVETDLSGPRFIHRVWHFDYIKELIENVAEVVNVTSTPWREYDSVFFEAVPRR